MRRFWFIALSVCVSGVFCPSLRPLLAQEHSEEEEAQINQSVDQYLNQNALNTFAAAQAAVSEGLAPVAKCSSPSHGRSSDLPPVLQRVEVSIVGGNLLGGKPGSKQDKTYQLAFGEKIKGKWGVEVSEYNEGDPANNHRDGFPVIATYEFKLTPKMRAKVGAGPYFTMNTTTINGTEHDEKKLGALASLIFLYRIAPNLDAELRYNQAAVPGEPGSKVLLAGVHGVFDGIGEDLLEGRSSHKELAVMAGYSHENRAGSKTLVGQQLEFRVVKANGAGYSVAVTQDRETAAVAQVWYVRPLNRNWTASAGVGVQENVDGGNYKPAGIVSLEFSRKVGKHWSVGFRANRRVSGDDEDRDNFDIIGKREF
jgi:hypothetical protein